MGKLTISMAILKSYVNLPEGMPKLNEPRRCNFNAKSFRVTKLCHDSAEQGVEHVFSSVEKPC